MTRVTTSRTAGPPPEPGMRAVLLRNVLSNVTSRGASIAAWFAIMPYVLRTLGPERFGFWSLLSTLAATALLLDLGVGSAVTKFVAEHGRETDSQARRGAFTTGALIGGVLSLLWCMGGVLGRGALVQFAHVGPAWSGEAASAAGTVALASAVGLLASIPGAALTGVHRLDLLNRITVVATLVQVTASLWLLAHGAGLRGLSLALLLGSATSLVASGITLHRIVPGLALDLRAVSRDLVSRQLRFAVALQIIALGVWMQFQLPKFALARWAGLPAVGEFELGYRVAFAAWSLPSLLLPPLLPAIAELASKGEWERAWSLHDRAGRYLLALALPLAALLAFSSGPLFLAWLGPGHAGAGLALVAIASLLGVNVLTSAGCLFVRATGRPGMEAAYHALSFCIQLALSVVLVPRWGLAGGLAAMLVSGTIGTVQFLWVFHRGFRRPLGPFLTRIVAAPALISLAGAFLAATLSAIVTAHLPLPERARAAVGWVACGVCGAVMIAITLLRVRYVSREEVFEVLRHAPTRLRWS